MNTNRLVRIVIVIALLAVGGFTLRAVLNSRELLSTVPTDIPNTSIPDVVEESTNMEEVQEEPIQAPEVQIPETGGPGLVFLLLVGKWFQQKTYENFTFDR